MAEPGHYGAPYTVDANLLPEWLANASSRFGVIGPDAWKVTALTSVVRGIQFNEGTGWSDGILTKFDSTNVPAHKELPVTSETKYFMVVSRVNWQEPLTRTFEVIEGTASRALPVGAVDYYREPGVIADFPVALVQVPANSLDLGEIIDLRVWRGDNGILMANSELVMQYLDRPGTIVEVNNTLHRLKDGAWGVIGYTDEVHQPYRHLTKFTATDVPPRQYVNLTGFNVGPGDQGNNTGLSYSGGIVTVSRAGLYDISGSVTYLGGVDVDKYAAVWADGFRYRARVNGTTGTVSISRQLYLNAGSTVALQAYHESAGSTTLRIPSDSDLTHWTIRRISR